MYTAGIFTERPVRVQLFVFLLLILMGTFFSSFLGIGLFYLFYGTSEDMSQYPDMLRFVQLLSVSGTFLFPALAMSWLCSHNPKEYLSLKKRPGIELFILSAVSLILIMPLINLADILNKQMVFPEFLGGIEDWMRMKEESAERFTQLLLADNDFISVLYNLVVIAVFAAVGEEFFFRGALQRVFEKWNINHHLVIWLVAVLFSAFHLQFYGFITRLLLGAFLGYLLHWTGSICIPVFVHFLNNAVVVIIMSNEKLNRNDYLSGEIYKEKTILYLLFTVVSFALFLVIVRMLQKKGKSRI